jgi:hypothetical protein
MSKEPLYWPLRIPVRFVNGHWELELGGQIPIREFASGELVLDRKSIADNDFLDIMDESARQKILDEGTELLVSLTVKAEKPPPEILKRLLIPYCDMRWEIGAGYNDNGSSVSRIPPFGRTHICLN